MAHEKTRERPGPKTPPVDTRQVQALAGIMCTLPEIALVVGVSEDTLQRRPELKQAIAEGRAQGCCSIRRAQFKAAMGGNATMLIWLGKQVLGQRDNADVDMSLRFAEDRRDSMETLARNPAALAKARELAEALRPSKVSRDAKPHRRP